MASLCEREAIEGIIATFQLLETSLDSVQLPEPALVIVLDRLQDPGNVGTLIRTADAVGAAAVVLIEPCVDPFDRKTVRGSMGSLFNVPIVRADDLAIFSHLQEMGLRIVGTDVRAGIVWGKGILQGSVALILGNEAHGQSDDVGAYVEANATLPIAGKAESLNVAVAGGVLMYAWLRENEA
jgi:TrmH family RNA methyltransferase